MRVFATFREAVGQKSVREKFEGETVRVETILRRLEGDHSAIELFEADGSLHGFVSVLKNGREINELDGLDTELADGDTLSVFPPVSGG